MNNPTTNTTLLALLLALQDLDIPLTEPEQAAFTNIACQLQLEPDAWESEIVPDLLALIQTNPNLNQRYQTAKSKLDSIGDTIPADLLPTSAELEQVIPTATQPTGRGFFPVTDDDDDDGLEINNVAIDILSAPNPTETAKKLSHLEKLKQFLNQIILD